MQYTAVNPKITEFAKVTPPGDDPSYLTFTLTYDKIATNPQKKQFNVMGLYPAGYFITTKEVYRLTPTISPTYWGVLMLEGNILRLYGLSCLSITSYREGDHSRPAWTVPNDQSLLGSLSLSTQQQIEAFTDGNLGNSLSEQLISLASKSQIPLTWALTAGIYRLNPVLLETNKSMMHLLYSNTTPLGHLSVEDYGLFFHKSNYLHDKLSPFNPIIHTDYFSLFGRL